ncbi:hypothetical protein DV737_g1815, partial [Chaetothyriales sp. CBS 132003]
MASRGPKIVIIGGGLGGLALALSLHAHAIESSVYDARPEPPLELSNKPAYSTLNGYGGAISLPPNGLRVLDRLGVYGLIRDRAFSFNEIQLRSSRNLSLIGTGRTYKKGESGYQSVRVARSFVRRVLLDKAIEKGVKISYQKKAVSLQTKGTRTQVNFDDGSSVEADLVIGADGMHSKVRDEVASQAVPIFSGQTSIGGTVATGKLTALAPDIQLPCMILGRANAFAFIPHTHDGKETTVFATIEMSDRSRAEWEAWMQDKATLKQEMVDRHGPNSEWPQIVTTACLELDVERVSAWPCYKLPPLERYVSSDGRVVVLGDAAHGIPPHAGQGAAMAFEDAATLADVIAASSPVGLSERLSQWQQLRIARIKQVMEMTAKSGAARRATSSLLQQIIKEYVIWAYLWWNGANHGVEWLYGYDTATIEWNFGGKGGIS